MVFVPEGQHDSSQARSDWNHLENSPVPAGRLNESPRNQTVHQRAFHHPASIPQSLNPPSVTSVTSVRCSPPMRAFLAQKPNSPPKSLPPPSLNPLSVTSATSVRSLPEARLSRPETKQSTKKPSAAQPQSPLCDLRDLCAMLIPR
jgi:hypothetical protein